ncbi:MAG: hypothetical protein Q9191_002240 [Dirinaria sp. TL-2023a]
MLGWFTGSSAAPTVHHSEKGDTISDPEDVPETPAPQFALRALRSAFLGTPRPKETDRSSQHHATLQEPVKGFRRPSPNARNIKPNNLVASNDPIIDVPVSPAKGILLTPGTAANKRKTVSFEPLAPDGNEKANIFMGQIDALAGDAGRTHLATNLQRGQESQTTMSKSVFESQLEASKRRIHRQISAREVPPDAVESQSRLRPSLDREEGGVGTKPEFTIDLDQPCSRSGKHWKGEYDLYHKKTNREMRRVIQHRQTIKSYAQKKDIEATDLRQKLENELAKVALMEAKVSDLATELAKVRVQSDYSDVDPARLVHDLAKQTATAIRHKQIAEKYEEALEKIRGKKAQQIDKDDCVCITMEDSPDSSRAEPDRDVGPKELSDSYAELKRFQSATIAAEDKVSKLEKENVALKQKMARIKTEMQNYESRRLAREERLRKKEAKLILARENSDARLAQLELKHTKLLRGQSSEADTSRTGPSSLAGLGTGARETNLEPVVTLAGAPEGNGECQSDQFQAFRKGILIGSLGQRSSPPGQRQSVSGSRRSRSPLMQLNNPTGRRAHAEVDQAKDLSPPISPAIQEAGKNERAHNTQVELIDDALSYTEVPKDSDFSLLRRSTHAAMKELSQTSIDDNPQLAKIDGDVSVPDPSPCKPLSTYARRRIQSRQGAIPSPRPSLLTFATSPHDGVRQPLQRAIHSNTQSRRSSLLSIGPRNSTLGSRGALPPDRAEAAKKRLEARKEEKRMKVGSVPKAGC